MIQPNQFPIPKYTVDRWQPLPYDAKYRIIQEIVDQHGKTEKKIDKQ